jgi:uncharacterized protein YceH (UPF0502 family)
MALNETEVRVLAALIEKEAAVPESYPLTLNALRLACNQTTNRRPVVSYDDRTVEAALLSLKSVGLVRFVHPSHGGRTTRYRHAADERWHLSHGELLVLSALALRGAQTVAEIRARVDRLVPADESATVEEMLDTLAARSPEAFAERIGRRPGERDDRWMALLGDTLASSGDGAGGGDDTGPLEIVEPAWRDDRPASTGDGGDVAELRDQVEALTARVAQLEARLDEIDGQPPQPSG